MEFYPFYKFMRIPFNVVVNTYFRKVQYKNKKAIEDGVPVIIAMNHPNSFMDPISFAATSLQKFFFLARGDAFKKGIVSSALEGVGIIPIYRLMDSGREGVQKNDETFKAVTRHLARNHKVIIFAEGLCVQERRLRKLKKGCARMALGAMEELKNENVLVIPVGVNYMRKPDYFRNEVFFDVGEPIKVKNYFASYMDNKAKAVNLLTDVIEEKMRETVVHINDPQNDELVTELEEICSDEILESEKTDPSDLEKRHELTLKIVDAINKRTVDSSQKIAELKEKTKKYSDELRSLGIRDKLIRKKNSYLSQLPSLLLRTLLFIAGLPIWVAGLITNYLPYYTSIALTKKLIKDIEWYASVSMLVGMFAFFLWYLAMLLTCWFVFHDWRIFFSFAFLSIFSGWFSLHFSPFRKKLFGSWRLFRLKKNKTEYEKLRLQREEIMAETKALLVK